MRWRRSSTNSADALTSVGSIVGRACERIAVAARSTRPLPGHQLVQSGARVAGDTFEDVGKPQDGRERPMMAACRCRAFS